MTWRFFAILFWSLLPLTTSWSQEYLTEVRSFSTEDGLSSNNILKIFEDSRGYVWIGTANGLNRFDGKNFDVFFEESTPEHSNTCLSLNEDVNGNIWVNLLEKKSDLSGVFGNVYKLVNNKFQEQTLEDYFGNEIPFSSKDIKQIQQLDSSNILYMVTKTGEIYRYDGKFRLLAANPDFIDAFISKKISDDHSIYCYSAFKRTIWVIKENGEVEEILDRIEVPKNLGNGIRRKYSYFMKNAFLQGVANGGFRMNENIQFYPHNFQNKTFYQTIKSKKKIGT